MKTKILLLVGVALVVASAFLFTRSQKTSAPPETSKVAESNAESPHSRIPAYQTVAETRSLGPTLDPAKFIGKTRDAYKVARDIPETLAQLPCYCHCDRGFGHKSLHSCFEDDHAAQCAVCVDEALVAYRLEKQGLSAAQIREQIIAQFGG